MSLAIYVEISAMFMLPHFWHLDAVCLTVLVGLRLWVVPTWPGFCPGFDGESVFLSFFCCFQYMDSFDGGEWAFS